MRLILILGCAALTCGSAGCGDDDPGSRTTGQGPIDVIAGFYPLEEAAERVGGDRVSVTNLTPAGAEPHDLELTTEQVSDLEDAEVVFVLGRGFQPAVEEVADGRDGTTVELLRVLPVSQEGDVADEEDAEDGGLDPHVWLDPKIMSRIVDETAAALVDADPEGAEVFSANAEAYKAELSDLDDLYRDGLADCERSTIVVAHEAFGWLAERYSLTQQAIAGIAPDQEPDPRRLAELADLVEVEGITTIFTETLLSPDVAETLASEAGVDTAVLDPLEGLSEDARGDGDTYVSVMESNLEELSSALGCR